MEVLLCTLCEFSHDGVRSFLGHISAARWLFLNIKASMASSLQAELRSALKMCRASLAAVLWPDQDTASTFLAMGALGVENSCKAFWHPRHAWIASL